MFHLYDFLIYCFITAYTPGANNLLSMSNAIRLGFRRSLRFNLGILAGFTALLTLIGASGSFVWAQFGAAFCRFFARHTKAVNLVMALLLVYCAVSLFL